MSWKQNNPALIFLSESFSFTCQSCCWQGHCKKSRLQSSCFSQDYRDPIAHAPCTRKSHWVEINGRVDSKIIIIDIKTLMKDSFLMLWCSPPVFSPIQIFMWNIPLNPLTHFIKSGSRFDGRKVFEVCYWWLPWVLQLATVSDIPNGTRA